VKTINNKFLLSFTKIESSEEKKIFKEDPPWFVEFYLFPSEKPTLYEKLLWGAPTVEISIFKRLEGILFELKSWQI